MQPPSQQVPSAPSAWQGAPAWLVSATHWCSAEQRWQLAQSVASRQQPSITGNSHRRASRLQTPRVQGSASLQSASSRHALGVRRQRRTHAFRASSHWSWHARLAPPCSRQESMHSSRRRLQARISAGSHAPAGWPAAAEGSLAAGARLFFLDELLFPFFRLATTCSWAPPSSPPSRATAAAERKARRDGKRLGEVVDTMLVHGSPPVRVAADHLAVNWCRGLATRARRHGGPSARG